MIPSDHDLLRQYAHAGSQPAFAELVRRHLDLVYSAARRQVRSSALAEEVSQSVFLDLSRRAAELKPATPLVAWLHVVTRRTAIDVIRHESRRQAREQAAVEIGGGERAESALMKPNSSAWTGVEPLLDEAVEALNATDRSAILLRFFENKSLREIGTALGMSDDAAQKRVSRALDQLRTLLVRRGIAVTAAGLATDLSAHAIQAAPTALGPAISSGAAAFATSAVLSATAEGAKAVAMTTTQKFLAAASLALLVGGSFYEASRLMEQNRTLAALHARSDQLSRTIAELRSERASAARALAALSRPHASRPAATNPAPVGDTALEAEMQAWMQRAVRLKLLLADRPGQAIPEIKQFLTEEDLFNFAFDAKLGSESEIRESLARLRHQALNALGNKLPEALRAYLAAHGNALPGAVCELAPYFNPAIDPAILARYQPVASGQLENVPTQRRQTRLIEGKGAIDEFYDSRLTMGTHGFSLGVFDRVAAATRGALKDFKSANQGAVPVAPIQLLPFFDPPLRASEREIFLQRGAQYLQVYSSP